MNLHGFVRLPSSDAMTLPQDGTRRAAIAFFNRGRRGTGRDSLRTSGCGCWEIRIMEKVALLCVLVAIISLCAEWPSARERNRP
jgi:hypothetical protein